MGFLSEKELFEQRCQDKAHADMQKVTRGRWLEMDRSREMSPLGSLPWETSKIIRDIKRLVAEYARTYEPDETVPGFVPMVGEPAFAEARWIGRYREGIAPLYKVGDLYLEVESIVLCQEIEMHGVVEAGNVGLVGTGTGQLRHLRSATLWRIAVPDPVEPRRLKVAWHEHGGGGYRKGPWVEALPATCLELRRRTSEAKLARLKD